MYVYYTYMYVCTYNICMYAYTLHTYNIIRTYIHTRTYVHWGLQTYIPTNVRIYVQNIQDT